jgi:hypothetical protein
MTNGTTPSAAALPAPLNLSAPRVPGLVGAVAVAPAAHRPRLLPLLSVLGDAGGILSLVYIVPLVILAIGIPIALLVRLLAWAAGIL